MKVFTMKLCINCKHFQCEPKSSPETGHCVIKRTISLVTGELTPLSAVPFAVVQRLRHQDCGIDGKLFEEKEVPNAIDLPRFTDVV
jgi:hypothetical protein